LYVWFAAFPAIFLWQSLGNNSCGACDGHAFSVAGDLSRSQPGRFRAGRAADRALAFRDGRARPAGVCFYAALERHCRCFAVRVDRDRARHVLVSATVGLDLRDLAAVYDNDRAAFETTA